MCDQFHVVSAAGCLLTENNNTSEGRWKQTVTNIQTKKIKLENENECAERLISRQWLRYLTQNQYE